MRGKKAVSAGVSVAMLVPVVTLTAMLLVATVMQSELSQRAAGNAADLKAEAGKKLLRVSALRGPSNESLVNLYAAGKLPIDVDYLLAVATDGSVLAERSGRILTLNPGDNVTLAPSQLDPRLAAYDGDFWRMKREVRELLLHTSDGNTYHLSWGPWGGFVAAAFTTNTATTTTSLTTTTSTFTVTFSVIQTLYAPTTTTRTIIIRPNTFTTFPPFLYVSASCTAEAQYTYWASYGTYWWRSLSVSCNVDVEYRAGPPYSYSMSVGYYINSRGGSACGSSGTASSNSFTASCSNGDLQGAYGRALSITVSITVSKPGGGPQTSKSGSCNVEVSGSSGTRSCSFSM